MVTSVLVGADRPFAVGPQAFDILIDGSGKFDNLTKQNDQARQEPLDGGELVGCCRRRDHIDAFERALLRSQSRERS